MNLKTLASDRLAAAVLLLALLAAALVPMVAHAETAAEKVYHVAPEEIESVGPKEGGGKTHQQQSKPKSHHQAPARKHGAAPPVTDEEGSPPSESGSPTKGQGHAGMTPSGNDNHPGDKSDPRTGASPGAAGGDSGKGTVPTSPNAIDPEPAGDSGGSSPVLPILIAVAALAALSIGVAVYRQRGPRAKPTT